MLARGEADLGFQQVTELMHGKGFQYLGLLPAEVQNYTVWAAGVHSGAPQAEAARAFSRAMAAPESTSTLRKHGMETP
jgi:molybdate transport system substrate-binding protein